jgi:hypothetical protein
MVCFVGAMNVFQMVFFVTRNPYRCSMPKHIEQR